MAGWSALQLPRGLAQTASRRFKGLNPGARCARGTRPAGSRPAPSPARREKLPRSPEATGAECGGSCTRGAGWGCWPCLSSATPQGVASERVSHRSRSQRGPGAQTKVAAVARLPKHRPWVDGWYPRMQDAKDAGGDWGAGSGAYHLPGGGSPHPAPQRPPDTVVGPGAPARRSAGDDPAPGSDISRPLPSWLRPDAPHLAPNLGFCPTVPVPCPGECDARQVAGV